MGPDAREEGPIGEDVLEGEVLKERLAVQVGTEGGMAAHRLDLGGEEQRVGDLRDVERLDAISVARQQQLAALGVPQGEREHAVEAADGLGPPPDERLEHDLGVAVRAKPASLALEL